MDPRIKIKLFDHFLSDYKSESRVYYIDLASLQLKDVDLDKVDDPDYHIPYSISMKAEDKIPADIYPNSQYKIKRTKDILDYLAATILYLDKKISDFVADSSTQSDLQKDKDLLDHLKRIYWDNSLDYTYQEFDPIDFHKKQMERMGNCWIGWFHEECYNALNNIVKTKN